MAGGTILSGAWLCCAEYSPVPNFVLSETTVPWKGAVPFLLTQKLGTVPEYRLEACYDTYRLEACTTRRERSVGGYYTPPL